MKMDNKSDFQNMTDAINFHIFPDKTIVDTNRNHLYFIEYVGNQSKISFYSYKTYGTKFETQKLNENNFTGYISDIIPFNEKDLIFLADFSHGRVIKVNEDLKQIDNPYSVVSFPKKLILHPENSKLYVTSALEENITIIDLYTNHSYKVSTNKAILGEYGIDKKKQKLYFIDDKSNSLMSFNYNENTFDTPGILFQLFVYIQNIVKDHKQSVGFTALIISIICGLIYSGYYIKKIYPKNKKHSKWVLTKDDIFSINGALIVGILIFLTISGFEGQEHDLILLTIFIVLPFAISIIVTVNGHRGMGTIMLVSGLVNLIIAVILFLAILLVKV